jgi:chromosome segregation ATPase
MTYLVTEIWLCLVLAALMGVLAGWVVWGRRTERRLSVCRGRLARLRRNWETVEDRLAEALEHASELENARRNLEVKLEECEIALHSVLQEREDVFRNERRLLELTVRELKERLFALEAGQRIETRPLERRPERLPDGTSVRRSVASGIEES